MSTIPYIPQAATEDPTASSKSHGLAESADADARPRLSALGFNLLTTLGLQPYHRLLHRGEPDAELARLLQAYLEAGRYATSGDGETFDYVVVHCDGVDGRASMEHLLGGPEPLPFGAVLVAVWDAAGDATMGRERWVDAALAKGRSVEILPLNGRQWGVFRSVDYRIATPVSLGLTHSTLPAMNTATPSSKPSTARTEVAAEERSVDENSERLDQEIARYRDCVEVHNLPEIYHFWSHRYVRPKLLACGYQDVDDFFLQNILDVARRDPATRHRVASIGAGNCDLEVRLAVLARKVGVDNLLFHCLELNPHMIERGEELARQEGVADLFEFEVIDIDHWQPQGPHGVCIANHSLHHIVELEQLFAKIQQAIGDDGVFLTNDMIGRNGHMRWPEALKYVDKIWREMPRRYKYNHQLSRWEDELENWDCSKEGNEGIRAEDILPLLLESFHFESFMAFANIIDVFVDRSFGHNFDPTLQEDLDFIERVADLDEEKLDSGEVKPTHLVAAMRARPVAEPKVYRHWTPEFCVRPPGDIEG